MTDLRTKIRNAVSVGGIAKTVLAEEAGVHRNTLAGVDGKRWDPRLSTAEALSDAVDRIKERRA